MSEEWTAARIAELRRLAQEARREDAECEHLGEATVRFCYATDAGAVLSLLDALEEARTQRDALVAATEREAERVAIAAKLGVGEWDACVPRHLREPFFAAYRSIHPEWQQ